MIPSPSSPIRPLSLPSLYDTNMRVSYSPLIDHTNDKRNNGAASPTQISPPPLSPNDPTASLGISNSNSNDSLSLPSPSLDALPANFKSPGPLPSPLGVNDSNGTHHRSSSSHALLGHNSTSSGTETTMFPAPMVGVGRVHRGSSSSSLLSSSSQRTLLSLLTFLSFGTFTAFGVWLWLSYAASYNTCTALTYDTCTSTPTSSHISCDIDYVTNVCTPRLQLMASLSSVVFALLFIILIIHRTCSSVVRHRHVVTNASASAGSGAGHGNIGVGVVGVGARQRSCYMVISFMSHAAAAAILVWSFIDYNTINGIPAIELRIASLATISILMIYNLTTHCMS
jgi:hypothetical protein